MSLRIYKVRYDLHLNKIVQEFLVPKGSKVLSAQIQGDSYGKLISIWFEAPITMLSELLQVGVVGTGIIEEGLDYFDYLDTVQLRDGTLILHVYTKAKETIENNR